jgi:prepilin-type N-terminal cleavage/methylation domain-containing protein
MATGEVRRPRAAGFSLVEVLMAVAISAILVAMAANALTGSRKVARVAGQARLLVQRLQTVRTNAVSQGAAQGYYIAQNGPGAVGPDANTGFVYFKQNPTTTVVTYNPPADTRDPYVDTLPLSTNTSLVTVTGATIVPPAPVAIGFDMNGQVTVTPPPAPGAWPYCIQVGDPTDVALIRWVILFNDGTVKVQKDETWCP